MSLTSDCRIKGPVGPLLGCTKSIFFHIVDNGFVAKMLFNIQTEI